MDSADVFADVFCRLPAIDVHLHAIATGDIEGLVMGTDGNHPQAKRLGVLDRVLADCAQAKSLHGTPLAGLKLGRLESAPGRHPGAGQVSGLFHAQSVGNKTNVVGVGFDVLGVAAINLKPGQNDSAAQHMLAVKTVFTVSARAVNKRHPDPVADSNRSYI